MTTVLLIDDDKDLCELLGDYLALEGFHTEAIHDGAQAVSHCREHDYDAVILDIMLPSMQGLDVLREIRKYSAVPIIMLTARGADTDRIVGLELGADDYLPKPCNPRELAARLRAILRRGTRNDTPADSDFLQAGTLSLDRRKREARAGDKPLSLTGAEFNVLSILMNHCGALVSKAMLCREALGRELTAYDRSVDVHVSKLRKKMAEAEVPLAIVNVRGAGYQLTHTPVEDGSETA